MLLIECFEDVFFFIAGCDLVAEPVDEVALVGDVMGVFFKHEDLMLMDWFYIKV